jgi:DNA-binding MarR family transcriptional regulator
VTGAGANRRFIYLLSMAQRRLQQWTQPDAEGLTSAQSGVLFLLDAEVGSPIGKVAGALGIGPSAISGLVDRMEAVALVRRAPEPADGRAVRLFLTDKGGVAREKAKTRVAAINARLVEGFSEAELDIVAHWLGHVSESFRRDREP